MNVHTALIAGNEPLLRAEIRDQLTALWPDLEICAEAAAGNPALQALRRFSPDVLFLDIQMPGPDGLKVAQQARGKSHVVFISAHDSHAVAAFEMGALDYLQKPISAPRLATCVDRVKERLQTTSTDRTGLAELLQAARGEQDRYLRWLPASKGRELKFLSTDEICYLRADNKYASVVTRDAEYLLTSSLKQMRKKLDPQMFWQIHRSTVVNVSAIRSVHRGFRGTLDVTLKQRPEVLPVSAAHAGLFKHL